MYFFGITHHNPAQVITFLGKNRLITARKDVRIVAAGETLPQTISQKFIFLLDPVTASRSIKVLSTTPYVGTSVFAFASKLWLDNMSGCILLDSEASLDPMSPSSQPIQLRMKNYRSALRKAVPVRKESKDFLQAMVDHVKRGSLLNPLMSFIYTLPSATHQTPVKEVCAQFYCSGLTVPAALRAIDRRVGATMTKAATARLRSILESEESKKYQTLLKAYSPKLSDAELEALCHEHSASPYEVRYLLSVCGELDPNKRGRKTKV